MFLPCAQHIYHYFIQHTDDRRGDRKGQAKLEISFFFFLFRTAEAVLYCRSWMLLILPELRDCMFLSLMVWYVSFRGTDYRWTYYNLLIYVSVMRCVHKMSSFRQVERKHLKYTLGYLFYCSVLLCFNIRVSATSLLPIQIPALTQCVLTHVPTSQFVHKSLMGILHVFICYGCIFWFIEL